MLVTLITTIGGIIQARFIGPETLGYFNKFSILPGYLMFLHLGVFVSLNREYPYFLGKGDDDRAMEIVRNSLGWVYVCQCVFVLVLGSCAVHSLVTHDIKAAMAWFVQLIVGSLTFYMAYLGNTYRTSSAFVAWSKATIVSVITSFIFLPVVAYFNYTGLCIRSLSGPLANMLYAHKHRPVKVRPELDWKVIHRMMAYGFPMAVFGYMGYEAVDVTQRLFILKSCSERTLGLYAFSLPVAGAIGTISRSFQQVFTPRIAKLYGSSGNDIAVCYKYCLKCALVSFVSLFGIILVASFVIAPFITLVAPRYVEAIPIMKVIMWTVLIQAFEIPHQLLVIAKKPGSYALTTVIGFVAAVSIVYMTPLQHRTVTLIIIAFIVGRVLNVIGTQFALMHNIRMQRSSE